MDEEEAVASTLERPTSKRSQRRAKTMSRPSSSPGRSLATDMEPFTTLGQFSFAPSTQTTVVTTTTTTTTKFPPLIMRPPRRMRELDPKLYPLAASPTPQNLRNIPFVIDGKATVFREAEDTGLALEQLQEEQRILRHANGSVQVVEAFDTWIDPEARQQPNPFATLRRGDQERPASPESITDNDDDDDMADALGRPLYRAQRRSSKTAGSSYGTLLKSHPRIHGMRVSNPVTPESQPRSQRASRRSVPGRGPTRPMSGTMLPSPHLEQSTTFTGAHSSSSSTLQHEENSVDMELAGSVDRSRMSRSVARGTSHDTTVPTPPIESDDGHEPRRPLSRRALSSVPARLHMMESPSAHDGSLPSPSLSPVTAAANLQSAGYFADIDSNSDMASQHEYPVTFQDASHERIPARISFEAAPSIRNLSQESAFTEAPRFSNSSVTEIPAMLDYFEAIPDELKSYVMHQLLRRCPKNTLHMVADAVNPALKCDFLSILPLELALNIVKYLDIRSLCKAAQVSKKWRQMINGDEKSWKELFDADGFSLPEGEIQQAITEGWGWQDPHGLHGYEMNINPGNPIKSETEAMGSSPTSPRSHGGLTGLLRRSKRKAVTMLSNRNKQVKRKNSSCDASVDLSSINWMDLMSTAEGPYNAANAAILAVPHPKVGLASLKGLHLYKSLYRRHHLIRRNWIYEDTRPRHIAFRAHDTHVVTCLQFDTDKILTGSDDNNINVYDTKTGALRAKLVGHDGGVWALQYEGNTLVSGSTDRSVRVWDIEKGEERQVFRGHTSTVRCLQILAPVKVGENAEGKPIMMPKQAMIITGSRDSTLRVWKLPRSEDPPFIQAETDGDNDDCPYFVRTLTGHQHSVRAIAAHADTLVSGSYDYTVRVWKISTGETVHRLQGHTSKVYSVVLDHARNRCISGSMDNMVRIWSLDTGSSMYTLEGHSSLVGLLDLDCDRLVSAAADSTLRIWDPENGQCKATLSAHTGAITCFQHDGQKVISGSDRTLKLWNIKTGECIKDLLSDLSGVWQVKFNERRCVAAVQRDGLTYIEVLDFGAARDGIPESKLGHRIVVDAEGIEMNNDDSGYLDLDGNAD